MRVVHVYKDYPPVIGGIENHLQLLAEGQARRGLEVTVLVTATGRRTTVRREGGVEVIRAARLGELASAPLSPALLARLRRLEPDVVHLQFPYPVGEVAQLLARRGRALVVSYQSDVVRQRVLGWLYRPLAHRLLGRADRILASSEVYAESSEVLRRHAAKVTVVPLGVDVEGFAAADPDAVAALRRRHGAPLVLFVGRLRYYKGLGTLIEAMARLAAEHGATLLIAGRGPMEESLQRQARASPAADRIRFLGDVAAADLPALYAAADVFVLPSDRRSEAFGLAQVEAMAAGTPVVSTELGTGTSFVNADGETGRVVPSGDAGALSDAIGALLADPELRRAMGERARRRAREEFDAERMVRRVIAVYEEVLA